jgi:hypothetical protein
VDRAPDLRVARDVSGGVKDILGLAQDVLPDVRAERFCCDDFHSPPHNFIQQKAEIEKSIERFHRRIEFDEQVDIAGGGGRSPNERPKERNPTNAKVANLPSLRGAAR